MLKVSQVPRAISMPITFSATGKAGERVTIKKISWHIFRGEEFFAFDTSSRPGRGTTITAFVGPKCQFKDVPTWVFGEWIPPEERVNYDEAAKLLDTQFENREIRATAIRKRMADAAAKMTWETCLPALEFCFEIEFHETCKWEGGLVGKGYLNEKDAVPVRPRLHRQAPTQDLRASDARVRVGARG